MLLYYSPILILLALAPCLAEFSENDPEVTTPAGTFRGRILVSFSGTEYASFRGIPYALPPVGKRRFAKPEPFPKIKGVIDATEFGPNCPQLEGIPYRGQEDCLYLNVYTPLTHENKDEEDKELKKVFIFIHGGGFVLGASSLYVPGDFVTRADVVVVTMNYRLGWLGFMYGNSDSLPGNQAFLDQLLALQWVKDNIRAFGGDPDDVTLSGESAGSFSVAILSISPLAKNLFSKALLLSGVPTAFPTPPRLSNALIKMAAPKLGCDVDPDNENIDEVISCLKELPVEAFPNKRVDRSVMYSFISSFDEVLPRPILELMNDLDYLSEIGFFSRNYIVSITKDDGYILVDSLFGKIDVSSTDSLVNTLKPIMMDIPDPVLNSLVTEYSKMYDDLETCAIVLATDSYFIQAHIQFVGLFQKYYQRQQETSLKSNAYLLSVDHIPTYMPNSYMAHALDLTYIFDLVPSEFLSFCYPGEISNFTEQDWKMKDVFIDFVKIFMDTGTPGEIFTREISIENLTRQYISFSLQPSVGQDILGDRRRIWEELLPKWKEEHQAKEKEEKQEL